MTATARKTEHPAQHEREAARRYLEHDYASEHLRGQSAQEANRHAQAIDEEHPRARDIALTGTARELGQLPAHLRRHQREARARAGISAEQAATIRHEYRSRPHSDTEPDGGSADEPSRRERAQAAAGQAARTAGQAAGTAYETASDTDWGELVGQFFLWGMGLSILLLALNHARSISELGTGAVTAARAVMSPVVDPLNPKGVL